MYEVILQDSNFQSEKQCLFADFKQLKTATNHMHQTLIQILNEMERSELQKLI